MRDDLEAVAARIKNNGDIYLFLETLDESERLATYGVLRGLLKFPVKSFAYIMKKGPQIYASHIT